MEIFDLLPFFLITGLVATTTIIYLGLCVDYLLCYLRLRQQLDGRVDHKWWYWLAWPLAWMFLVPIVYSMAHLYEFNENMERVKKIWVGAEPGFGFMDMINKKAWERVVVGMRRLSNEIAVRGVET